MSRAALLLVVGEAFNETQKTLILDKINEDLQSWDDGAARCDLQKELDDFANEMQSLGDVSVSGTALGHNSDNLSISILFSPDRKLLHDSLQNFLLLDSHYRHLVYSGQTIAGSGSWILPDDVFTFRNFVKVLKDMDSVGVGGDGKGFALTVSSTSEWDWNKSNFSRLSSLGVKLAAAPGGTLGRDFGRFRAFVDSLVSVIDMTEVLKASSTVGMINFSGPTLYIFPGGNGSSALFGVKGFTGLVDGGYSRRSCSWHFSRHLHQIDMVILSHLGANNFLGMQSFLERKIEAGSPDVGSVFFNCPEKFRKLSPGPESLKVNLFDAGAALSEKLAAVGLQPQPCFAPQPYQPITLYNKVGFGSVDMYVLNPIQSSEELKGFLHQWATRAESESFSAHSGVPLSSALSVSVLLVWKPFSPTAKIVRILFPGGTPQGRIFEGLDRLKNIPVFERSECSQAELSAKPPRAAAQGRPTTLKPTATKVNGNADHKDIPKAKTTNGSRDSVGGKANAREPVLVKASVPPRATKVEPKKPDTSPTNGTASAKADSKSTAKPVSPLKPVKDVKTTLGKNVESLPPKRLAQKPSEAEASPKNKATKASQPEAVKQAKPAKRTEEVKASETTAKQTKVLNSAKEPAAKQLNGTKDSRAAKPSDPAKQTKASSAPETAKQGAPKPAKASKELEKKGTKQVETKKPKQLELEKKDLEKVVKEEVALAQPAEERKETEALENDVHEPVCVAVTTAVVEETSVLPPDAGPIAAGTVLGNVEAAARAVDYDLPSPEDVAQMSQEDEDSFVEELPTEMEPGFGGDQKDKDSGIAQTTDPDLIGTLEPRDDTVSNNIEAVGEDKFDTENGFEGNGDLINSHESHKSSELMNDVDFASREIAEDRIDAELEEDLEFERDEEAVKNLNESVEDDQESGKLGYVHEPDVVPGHDISGVTELGAEENVEGVDDGEEKEGHEDLIGHDHEDVLHETAAAEEKEADERDELEKEDMENGPDLEEYCHLEREPCLEEEQAEEDLSEYREKQEEPNSWLLQDSRSPLVAQGAFQAKRATDGLARYCEEFGSDEGEAPEEEERHAGVNEGRVACTGGIQVPAKKVDDDDDEEEDELEAVEEEEEAEEEEAERFETEHGTVPEVGCEVDILSEDVDNGGYLPDVLGHEQLHGKEDVEIVASSKAETLECSADRNEELATDEGFGRDDDFDKGGDFAANNHGFGKGEEDLGEGDAVEKVGDFGRAEEEAIAEMEGRDDDASDVDLSENKEGVIAGEGSGGSVSDNEAEEKEPGARSLESTDEALPCALKKDTAIENLAAICAETREEGLEDVERISLREQMVGAAPPDLVAACESLKPQDVEMAIEMEEEDRALTEDPDVVGSEGVDGFETEQDHNLSMDDGISQGKPQDLHLFDQEDEEEQPSWKLDDLAANIAHDVIQSSLAAQNLDASACFASGPVSTTLPNGTEKPGHELTPETHKEVSSLIDTMVDAVATSNSTSSGRFNYGFDDERKDAFAENSSGGASAVVHPPLLKSGEDSGESDLDEGQDACHQGQRGLELGNEPEDVSRLDEGFEESTGDESPANVTELLHLRVENAPSRAEENDGPSAFAYGASGEFADEDEDLFGSAGGPASEKTVDDSSPLVDFDSDVTATHQVACGNGCVEAHREADAWQRNNRNPFADPSAEAEEKEHVERDEGEKISSNAGLFEGMTASGLDSEGFDRKLEGDEQSIPSDDNADLVLPHGREHDMADEKGGVHLKETPEDKIEDMSTCAQFGSLESNVNKSQVVEETSGNKGTASFLTHDDNVQSSESATNRWAADNILFSEETTSDVARDINENLGATNGPEDEDQADDLEKVSTQSNASEEEGESRSSAVLSEPHEGAESLDSDVEPDPVKSWGQPMGLPAPMQDSNRTKAKMGSRPTNEAMNSTLPASMQDKKPAAKTDRSFVAPQKKVSDVRKSGPLKTAAEPDSKENGTAGKDAKVAIAKKTVASAAPLAKKQTATSVDTSKSKPLKHVVPFYVDLTYIPGNGDPAYVDADFFRRVRARYYVLSSLDPDPRVLSCLVEGKQTWENKDLSVNVIPTHDSTALHRWFHENARLVEELKISLLPAANKCTIKLQDKDDGCYAFRIEF